jgi:two-component system sensor histidine kinase ChvG
MLAPHRPPRISFRLFAFNVLLVFLPVGSMLILGTYERELLDAQERTMAQEGRLLAAAIEAQGRFDGEKAGHILVQLGQRHLARLRVVDRNGAVVADSALLGPRREPEESAGPPATTPEAKSLLYRIGSLPFRLFRGAQTEPSTPTEAAAQETDDGRELGDRPEVRAALEGRYGAATRINPEPRRSVTLHIAIPVRIDGTVEGAVLVSQSTGRILQALDAVRLDAFKVFLFSLGAAVVLSLVAATTIARPLARLKRRAEGIVGRKGRLLGGFTPSERKDEIGDLERALAQLTRQLEVHLRSTEAFAADVSHEFKNPLASIRTATDMALEVDDAGQRRRFLRMIEKDVARMERLLTEAREISRIDACLDEEEPSPVVLDELLEALVEAFRMRLGGRGPQLYLTVTDKDTVVSASADRLTQVFENLIDNAISFSPSEATIRIELHRQRDTAEVVIEDEGPGIPDEHLDRIFSRFFTYRPEEKADDSHTGLGLALVRAIVEAYGGSVSAGNSDRKGARLVVRLPTA